MSLRDLLAWTHENGGRMSTGQTQTSTSGSLSQHMKGQNPTVLPIGKSNKGGSNKRASGALQVRANVIKRRLRHLDKATQI
jgi:hypothetical protein